jgi:DNA helicase-2/ATP-dependent DNA helicase PcrA
MAEEDPILVRLNAVQRDCVVSCDGPVLVLAGAGSGKTRAVTHKVAYLLMRLRLLPYQVLAVTFTNKAAGEMKRRVRELVGPAADGVELGTFHGVCAKLLRRHAELIGFTSSFTIHDADDSAVLMKHVVRDLKLDEKEFAGRQLASVLDHLRNRNETVAHWVRHGHGNDGWREKSGRAFAEYEQRKVKLNAMDFSDLLVRARDLLRGNDALRESLRERFRYVLVDEMQDTNLVQLQLLEALVGPERRICAVGDDDQSIYGWRGARVRNMLEFERVFPGTRVLRMEQNYRSTQTILDAAHCVISKNEHRHAKRLWTENEAGEKLVVVETDSEGAEARRVGDLALGLNREGMPFREMAVFFRTNAQSRSFEEMFTRTRIPYVVVGGMRFYERAEVKDALAYLKLLANDRDDVPFQRVVNVPPRGIGKGAVEKLTAAAQGMEVSLLAAARRLAAAKEMERWMAPVAGFVGLVDRWREAAGELLPSALMQKVLEESGYLQRLTELDPVESESRQENLDELLGAIRSYEETKERPSLEEYLQEVSLLTDVDLWDAEDDRLPLMTVHAAKGLEFSAVFVTGLEEGLFPHENHQSDEELEEERRLFYVALTRARRRLFLTYARSRLRWGRAENAYPSPFVREISPDLLVVRAAPMRRSYQEVARRAPVRPRPRTSATATDLAYRLAGMDVRHGEWGTGKVLAVVGQGPKALAVVKFAAGVKTLPVAQLETA